MTRRHPGYDIYGQPTRMDPRDFPDPLTVEPDDPVRFALEAVEAHRREPRRLGCSVFVLAILAILLIAAPRGEPVDRVIPRAGDAGSVREAQAREPILPGAPLVVAEPASALRSAGDYLAGPLAGGVPQTYTGTASWYSASGDVGSVPWWRAGQDPVWASVCTFRDGKASCVTVLVVGWCACLVGQPGERVMDLSDDAFRQLAPLSAGLIRVTVELTDSGPGLPATDMRP